VTDRAIVSDLAPAGVLRASINLGNPVLAQGTPSAPSGVTVDIARLVAARLGVPVELACFSAARDSLAALLSGQAAIGFLGIDPARAAELAFTPPYVLIEGVYAVPADSPLRSVTDVDAPGVRVGVKRGSAYDLHLTRTLSHATVVRGDEGTAVFASEGLEAAAGIRAPVTAFVASHPGLRLIGDAFMQIQQAAAVARDKSPATVAFLSSLVEELRASGFIADALSRSGQTGVIPELPASVRRAAQARTETPRAAASKPAAVSNQSAQTEAREAKRACERSFERSGEPWGPRERSGGDLTGEA
jgi:polar amino acid transport system substrate-binding protein